MHKVDRDKKTGSGTYDELCAERSGLSISDRNTLNLDDILSGSGSCDGE